MADGSGRHSQRVNAGHDSRPRWVRDHPPKVGVLTAFDGGFWDRRVDAHGHTGWADPDLYQHDQQIRLHAVERTLKRFRVWPVSGTRVLDVGCGTGDFARALAGAGASVVAIDLSPRVIEEARRRTFGLPALTFRVAAVEDLSLEPASLDLITSVTVLQHLADDGLDAALARFSVALKAGGHALALEIAPAEPWEDDRTPYVHVRSRDEWVRRFEAHGLALRAAVSYPQFAVILLNRIGRARGMAPRAGEEARPRRGLRRIAYRGILAASWLFDRILTVPPPAALALYRIFLFRRNA